MDGWMCESKRGLFLFFFCLACSSARDVVYLYGSKQKASESDLTWALAEQVVLTCYLT